MPKAKDYFETICNLNRAFGGTLDYDEILKLVVENAKRTMDGKAACLFLEDRKTDMFHAVAQAGLSDDYLHTPPKEAKKLLTELIKEGHLAVKDAATDPRIADHETKRKEGIVSMLVVPVNARGKVIGVLTLYSGEPRDFSEDDIKFLSALAESGGMALQTVRLIDRINKNSELFFELSASINSSLEIKKILHIMTAQIAESFGMKGVIIRLMNPDSGSLDLVASYGLSEAFLNKGPISLETGSRQAMQGETVIIEDVSHDDRVQYVEACVKEGIASMLCVPIKNDKEVIGVMKLMSEEKGRQFTKDMLIMVKALAIQGGLAIQNASMYLMLQEDKEDLEKDIWSHRQWF